MESSTPWPFDVPPTVVVDDVHVVYRVYGSGTGKGNAANAFRRILRRQNAPTLREVHAVKGVSFTAYEGEAIGLIGRNGSGKSTLLRAIAGLLPPERGTVWTRGKASLLGVNAALMNDLSGERNVELGCLAMGMTPQQVKDSYEDIVDFAGIGDFISLPMRTYSSGMGARLRFAIAAAQSHDVLLIDEALATGDAEFRQKSERRIAELREEAGTVFLVSHSLAVVRETCDRAIWLEDGRMLMDGPADDVVDAYEARYDPKGTTRTTIPLYPLLPPSGADPTSEEWFDMATEDDLRRIVREEIVALLTREDSPLAVDNDDFDPQQPRKGGRRLGLTRAVYRAYSQSRKAMALLSGDGQPGPGTASTASPSESGPGSTAGSSVGSTSRSDANTGDETTNAAHSG
ncbi:MAG: ABC transporter ATP-binding protein [Actinomycetales bacterium]